MRFASIAVLLGTVPVLAQQTPDVKALMQLVSQTYQTKQYEFEIEGKTGDNTAHARIVFDAGKYRMEGGGVGGAIPKELGDGLIVHDGAKLQAYLSGPNVWFSAAADAVANSGSDLRDMRPEAMDNFTMGRFRSAAKFADARVLRQETLPLSGQQVNCMVVEFTEGSTRRWWIDPGSGRVLRDDGPDSSTVYVKIRLTGPAMPEDFRFTPPPGSRQIQLPGLL